ncbi:hypothetical protein [Corynebacterium sp. A21]|uniref:hypothetical protein n=1 Tax=Corynebacterium sp. A21 TaxID=3457318 RepID=UPI003FD14DF7
MSEAQTRSTLAHEIAHAESGDPCGHLPMAERSADRRATQILISTSQYAEIERIYGPDLPRIAEELCVTIHHATIWRDHYARINAL